MSIGVGVDEDCVVKLHVRPVFIASSVGPASRRVGVICSALLSCYNLLIAAVHSFRRLYCVSCWTRSLLRFHIVVNEALSNLIVARGLYIR